MTSFTTRIELSLSASDVTTDQLDAMMEALAAHHGALGASALGRIEATITVEANDLLAALAVAVGVVAEATGLTVTAVAGATSDEFDAASLYQPIPTLRTITGAAKSAQVNPQTIHNAVADKRLRAVLADGKRLIPQASLNTFISNRTPHGKEQQTP